MASRFSFLALAALAVTASVDITDVSAALPPRDLHAALEPSSASPLQRGTLTFHIRRKPDRTGAGLLKLFNELFVAKPAPH
jgi:hypothetical protein